MPTLPRSSLRAKPVHSSPDASHVLAGLRRLYPLPEWGFYSEVRSSTGAGLEVLRSADALAVNLWPSSTRGGDWTIHGFEAKVSRGDWVRELRQPEKSGPLKLFCSAWWLAVPAPWKRIVLAVGELPDRWGLVEIGTGVPRVVVQAAERDAGEPTPGFLRALLRAASREALEASAGVDQAEGVPVVPVTRPTLSRAHVGLACGHVAPRPLSKGIPARLPCWACAEGRPLDREIAEAVIAEASAEERQGYLELLTGLKRTG